MLNIILVGSVIFFTVISQIILKIGQHTFYYPRGFSTAELVKMTAYNLSNIHVIACILFTLIAGLVWLLVIQNMPLSRAYPFMSLNYVIVYLISWAFFNEAISFSALCGIFLIMIGTGLLGIR
jgi:multidrug transporter EmrE-like cation transporter